VKILLTGASSFTGHWFAKALAAAGHEVVAPLRGAPGRYEGARAARVGGLENLVRLVPECPFGEAPFLALIAAENFDLLCHHAAEVGDYRSADFDVAGALAANTRGLRDVLGAMTRRRLAGVVLTGSVFEQDEGAGEAPLRAFSPYGLSKGLTAAVFRYWCGGFGVPLGRFIIANPFGPLEEPRFGAYLLRTWRDGKTAEVRTPRYVRDNVPVRALAEAYAGFVAAIPGGPAETRLGPSFYVETQGAFAERFARETRARSGLACALTLAEQSDFSEPLMRVNTDPLRLSAAAEAALWDDYVETALADRV
jgi:nucleoside-diphosphate-sugar epimerase